ncbi:pentapeptide repeat-containing protein [Rhizobium mayense]|uniref:Pentapeptide repeat-containing protein n=1 Tax=Rhizobium mayense TaxID=1312184 RepID=A0ABT7JXF1_9HYPH|nr:pentapeptide repeat-containing protein [Rhizobium mayense]MDL2401023.1 pentapeptide repeat-containing protein [Rhizobium mayense]
MRSWRGQNAGSSARSCFAAIGEAAAAGLSGLALVVAILLASGAHDRVQAADCGDVARPGLNWSECSKTNIMLQGSDLHGANLAGVHFDSTDLSNANLTLANLEKATLVRTWLKNARAEAANFSRIEAYRSDFTNILATGARFVSAELQRAEFGGAQLANADFQKAELGRADFEKAVLTGVNFSLANLSRATLSGATIKGPVAFDGAFMFLTRIEGLDLSAATGLTQQQISLACGDKSTVLPAGLKMPEGWPCPPDDKD